MDHDTGPEDAQARGRDQDWVTGSAIYPLLKRLLTRHCILTVRIGTGTQAFASTLLEVERKNSYMVLDELIPANGHRRLLDDPHIQVRAVLDGLPLAFPGLVTRIGDESGRPYYKVPFPESVYYPQQRREYRVMVPIAERILVAFHGLGDEVLSGELRDLSASGFSALVVAGDIAEFSVPGQRCRSTLHLPGNQPILAPIEIRHVARPRDKPRVHRIGALFVDVTPQGIREIERYIALTDRTRHRRR